MNVLREGEAKVTDVLIYPPKGWTEFFKEVTIELDIVDSNLEKQKKQYLPEKEKIFTAFYLTPFDKIKVVILGQDPYDTLGYAMGLSFSCDKQIPKSLDNVFKVLEKTVKDFTRPKTGDLTKWALQGVFLINTALTVVQNTPKSHSKVWEDFTSCLFGYLEKRKGVVYMLWGNDAKFFKRSINVKENLVLETSHPSPLAAHKGFMDCNHFNEANEYLVKNKQTPIKWNLDANLAMKKKKVKIYYDSNKGKVQNKEFEGFTHSFSVEKDKVYTVCISSDKLVLIKGESPETETKGQLITIFKTDLKGKILKNETKIL